MIRIKQAVIVEGKYDKIALENLLDATIIYVNGFGIFKDREKMELIRILANRDGVIVLTDSDSAGMLIRSHIKNICKCGNVTNVYVPQLKGKEKRKKVPSKEGFLGVEGLSKEILLDAFQKSGVFSETAPKRKEKLTKNDLFSVGLSGTQGSCQKRNDFAAFCNLPQNLSSSAFFDMLNAVFTKETFKERVTLWQQETDKK